MKKILLTMAFVLTGLGSAWAAEVTVTDITIPQGSIATLEISLTNEANQFLQLFQIEMHLPDGITVLPNSAKLSNRFNSKAQLDSSNPNSGEYRFVCSAGTDKTPISGTEGVIMTVQLKAATTATGLKGTLTQMEITDNATHKFNPTDNTFNITIGESLGKITLDENETKAPDSSGGVAKDVTVIRTIKANQWSTICLPFDMTEGQVKAAFGDDVELADFTSWSFKGTSPNVESIELNFAPATTIAKNHPYMIRVTSAISSFEVKNVVIDPAKYPINQQNYVVTVYPDPELDPFGDPSSTTYRGYLYGVYYSQLIPNKLLFISNDTFWCSNGSTTIKGYRAMFRLQDGSTLITIDSSDASARISFTITDDATKIANVNANDEDGRFYNLSGQKVENPVKKGLYITKGKKVVIK
jgi:hypothetical protein